MKSKADSMQTEKRIRLSLELTPLQYQRLQTLERDLGLTKADIVRQALQKYEYLAQRSLAGDRFLSLDKNGDSKEVVFIGL